MTLDTKLEIAITKLLNSSSLKYFMDNGNNLLWHISESGLNKGKFFIERKRVVVYIDCHNF